MIGVPCVSKWLISCGIKADISSPLDAQSIFTSILSKVCNTKLTSVEPIHCLLPMNAEGLSPMSTKHCCILRWEGIGISV